MTDIIWGIKLKLNALLSEVKWNLKLREYTFKNLKKLTSSIGKIVAINSIIFMADFLKILTFMRDIFSKKLIIIPLIILLLLFSYYISLINGKPNKNLFQERYLPKFYYDSAIEVRDLKNRLVGSMAQPQSLSTHPSLYVNNVPNFFWSLLKEQHDKALNFEDNATIFGESLFENPFYYNGIDVNSPFRETKELLTNIITQQRLAIPPSHTLTEQLINSFLKKDASWKKLNNIERLKLAKTFFHSLKANDGANFKAWLLTSRSFFFLDNKGYGFKDCAEIFFGRAIEDLSLEEQAIMVALYHYPYRLNISLKKQKEAWKKIKEEAISIINTSHIIDEQYALVSKIKKMPLPHLPYFPDALMEIVGKITPSNQESFSSLPMRSERLLNSIKGVLTQELNKLFQIYSISPKSRLVTKVGINFHITNNYYFNYYLNQELDDLKLSTYWVSIVNEKGEFVKLYQKNSTYETPPKIGNIAKVFSLLLFANRGDKYYTKYCNKNAKDEIPYEEGFSKCQSNAWIDARELVSSAKMLPLYDGFIKYKQRDQRANKVYYTPIYRKEIEALYQNLSLIPLQNNEPRVDLGAGELQMTPLDMQVAIHKIAQLTYRSNNPLYTANLVKTFDYHPIKEGIISPKSKQFSLDSPEPISPLFKKFFTREKRITLQTLFKIPIYKKNGSLQWLKNYRNIKFVFAQESHKDGIHWLVGAFEKNGEIFSFTIHAKDNSLSKYLLVQEMKKILEKSIKSINNPDKVKFNYMKQIFQD